MATPDTGLDAFPIPHAWLSDVDKMFANEVRAYLDATLSQRGQGEGLDDALVADAWRGISLDLGLQAAIWPESVGGAGLCSPRSAAFMLTAVAEQLGRSDVGLGMLLASSQAMVAPLVTYEPDGNARMIRWASDLLVPKPLRVALVMPSMGWADTSLPLDEEGRTVQAVSRADGTHHVLHASRARPLCGGADADFFGVVAEQEGALAAWWVPANAPGVQRHAPIRQIGLTSCRNAEISLSNVPLDPDLRWLAGPLAIRSIDVWFSLLAAATCVGASRTSFEILSAWGNDRVIKGRGQTFKNNPLAASLMAEVAAGLHRNRILVYHLAHMVAHPEDHGHAGGDETSVTASHIAQHVAHSVEEGIHRTMEMMGSAGYARAWRLERFWRDIKGVQACLGGQVLSSLRVARHHYGSTCR